MAWVRYSGKSPKRARYDEIILSSPGYPVYLLSWYLDAVCVDWEFLLDEEQSAVFPIPIKRKWGIRYAIQPLWVQQLGVISTNHSINPDINLWRAFQDLRFLFFRVRGSQLPLHHVLMHQNLVLNIDRPYAEINRGYHDQNKRHIKKAASAGLSIKQTDNYAGVFNLFLEGRGADVQVNKADMKQQFECLSRRALSEKAAEVWEARNAGDEILGAVFLLVGRERVIFLLSGQSASGKKIGAMSFIIDQAIRAHACKRKIFDFEGSDQEGLARYYSGFGAEKERYHSIFYTSLPIPFRGWLRKKLKNKILVKDVKLNS